MREKPASEVVPVFVIKQTVERARRESVLVYTLGVLENIDDHLILSAMGLVRETCREIAGAQHLWP
jgi:hypothetical protein